MLKDRYLAVQASLRGEYESLRKLMKLKRGLMQDLLTGAIPVAAESAIEPRKIAANV
jgi:hypothetical protein